MSRRTLAGTVHQTWWVLAGLGAAVLVLVAVLTTGPPAQAPKSGAPPAPATSPPGSDDATGSGPGVPPGLVLSPSGSITVTEPGTVVDAVHVTGYVHVRADDVTIRRSRVTYGGAHSIRVFDGVEGTRIVESTIECRASRTNAVVFGNYRAERVAVEGCRNDFMSSDGTPAMVLDSLVDGQPFTTEAVPAPVPTPRTTSRGPGVAASGPSGALTRATVIQDAGPRVAPVETLSSDEARDRIEDTGLLEAVEVLGGLDLSQVARAYTVRDVVVNANGSRYGIRTTIGSGAVRAAGEQVLEHVEVFGASSAGLYLGHATVRHANVWGSIDNIKSGDRVEVYASWLHDLAYVDGAHSDAIQIRAGVDQLFHGNVIEARHGDSSVAGPRAGEHANAGLQTGSMTGPASARFHDNWWSGGYYTVRITDRSAAVVDYQFRGNTFARDHQYGALVGAADEPSVFGGARFDHTNVWEDSGEPVVPAAD